jgi:hypothetical protein
VKIFGAASVALLPMLTARVGATPIVVMNTKKDRVVRLLSSRSQQGSSAPQSTPAKNFGLSNSGK